MSVRDYGLGDSTPYVTGAPVVGERSSNTKCPHCRCETVFVITVPMKHPRLKGEKHEGKYLGCPACPWASPCVISTLAA